MMKTKRGVERAGGEITKYSTKETNLLCTVLSQELDERRARAKGKEDAALSPKM